MTPKPPRQFDVLDAHIYGGACLLALGAGGVLSFWAGLAVLGAVLLFLGARN
jgi:hypothetical protein